MSLYQKAETFIHQRKFREEGKPTLVDSAEIIITYPCDESTASVDMVEAENYTYQGVWQIPSDADYGEYTVTVTATAGTCISKFVDSFIVLPWNITQHIRKISGIKENNSINDDDIALIAWNAYLEAKEDMFKLHINEEVSCYDNCCRKIYLQKNILQNHLVCDEDVATGYYLDIWGNKEEVSITVEDEELGEISVTKADGSDLPCSVCKLYVTYRTYSEGFSEHLFKKAVTYLAAHEIVLRFNELDKATLADLDSNKPIIIANPDRMLKNYKRIRSKIGECKYGGI